MEFRESEKLREFDDITMIKYYSPQYKEWIISGLKDSLDDVYNSGASRTSYEEPHINITSPPVDVLAMRAISIKNQMQNFEKAHRRHRGRLNEVMRRCTPLEQKQIKDYFIRGFDELLKVSFNPDNLPNYPIVKHLKKELYRTEAGERHRAIYARKRAEKQAKLEKLRREPAYVRD